MKKTLILAVLILLLASLIIPAAAKPEAQVIASQYVNAVTLKETLDNGRTRMTITGAPQAYYNNGQWKKITNTIGASGEATYTLGVNELFNAHFTPVLSGSSPFLHVTKGNSEIILTAMNANTVTGVISDNRICYNNAWNNADMCYTIAGHLISKEIKLRAGHPSSFAFKVNSGNGLNADLKGLDFSVALPVLISPDGLTVIQLTFAKSTDKGKPTYTINLPAGDYTGWVLDPTFTDQGTTAKDTYITNYYDVANYGAATTLNFGWRYSSPQSYSYKSILYFDVSSIPSTATITSSNLYLYRSSNDGTYSYNFAAYKLRRYFDEGTRDNANDAPATGATWLRADTSNLWGTAGANNTSTDIYSSYEDAHTINYANDQSWSIPNMTSDWVSNSSSNYGVIIASSDASANSNGRFIAYSSDYGGDVNKRPKLVIEYTTATNTPTVTNTATATATATNTATATATATPLPWNEPYSCTLTGFTADVGTSYVDTWTSNDIYWQLHEAQGTTNQAVTCNFPTYNRTGVAYTFEGYYTGGHSMSLQCYNYTTASWTSLTSLTKLLSADETLSGPITADCLPPTAGDYLQLRLFHASGGNSSHDLDVDYLHVSYYITPTPTATVPTSTPTNTDIATSTSTATPGGTATATPILEYVNTVTAGGYITTLGIAALCIITSLLGGTLIVITILDKKRRTR